MGRTKRKLSVFFAATLLLACFSAGVTAWGGVSYPVLIDEEHFPDPVWRSVVSSYYDLDGNGELSETEAQAVTRISPLAEYKNDGDVIYDLTGIEYFTALKTLRAADVGLKSIDISALPKLTSLDVQGNSLTSLDVSGSDSLTDLNCRGNEELTELTLCSTLTKLQCDGCALTTLDVGKCASLATLVCYDNELTVLDLSNNTALTAINCSENHLTSLDLSATGLAGKIVSSSYIGGQTAAAAAYYDAEKGIIYVPLQLDDCTKITSSNIAGTDDEDEDDDEDENSGEQTVYCGYDSTLGAFAVPDYEMLAGGITYTYGVSLTGDDADMDVTLEITKNFYRVRYYISDTAAEPISTQYINSGCDAVEPQLSDSATCAGWTHDGKNITQDTDIYYSQNESHSFSISAFDFDSGTVTFTCDICSFAEKVRFIDYVNVDEPENAAYFDLLDENDDGAVDASDYAAFLALFGV